MKWNNKTARGASASSTRPLAAGALCRSATAVAIGVLFATAGQAQQSDGAITGRGTQGQTVTAENPSINIRRTVVVEEDGVWTLPGLPAGEYEVTLTRADGKKETQRVRVTAGARAFAAFGTDAQTVTVVGQAVRSIDVTTPTDAFTLTADEISRTPVAQNVTAVTMLAPGTTQGDGRIGGSGTVTRPGNLASIGGASVAENAYYINGFNVTNIVKGIAFNEVPFLGIGEIQIRNSGYGAEFGRSLGGVISVTTKRGTNEWKGGGSLSYVPTALQGSSVYAEKDPASTTWSTGPENSPAPN
jgi:Carboxypeptidase regulatory-like domain